MLTTARQPDAGVRAWRRIRVHAQEIQATGEALPATAGEFQTAGARVVLAVKTFAAHQARPVEVRAQVAVEVEMLVEAEVRVRVRVRVRVQVQMEVEVEVEVEAEVQI